MSLLDGLGDFDHYVPPSPAPGAIFDEGFTVPRQLPGESYPLSDQQMAIAEAAVAQRLDVAVRAKAGSGKTTTLEALARRFTAAGIHDRILYVAFNASVKKEADQRMPDNVEPRTGHSLAWSWAGDYLTGKVAKERAETLGEQAQREAKFLRSKPVAVAKEFGIVRSLGGLSPAQQGSAIIAIVGRYANSADDKIGRQHFFQPDGRDVGADLTADYQRERLLNYANEMWADLCKPLGRGCRFKATFDHIRKMWALARPDLKSEAFGPSRGAQILFLDEAQDTPPVLAKVIADQQGMQTILVGDADQAIYGFTGAKDALSKTHIKTSLPLTTSYRFGPGIQDIANRFLGLLDSPDRVIGYAETDRVDSPMNKPQAVLTRTNVAMLTEIVRERGNGRTVGVLDTTKAELTSLAETGMWLRDGARKPAQPHEILAQFDTWNDFMFAALGEEAAELKTIWSILNEFGPDGLARIVKDLIGVKEAGMAARNGRIDVLLVTAHKAKGLEWDKVKIGDDFARPWFDKRTQTLKMPSDEDMRLAYVAVTRARWGLDPGSLDWVFDFTTANGEEADHYPLTNAEKYLTAPQPRKRAAAS